MMMRRRVSWAIGILLGIGVIVSAIEPLSPPLRAVTQTEHARPTLAGTVRTGDGEPLEGVAVSARETGSTITRTVFTDQGGEFFFPVLGSGHYSLWAQATGFDAGRAEVALDSARTTHHAFTMQPLADITMQLMGSEWLASLPTETKAQRRMREIFRVNCALCHSTTVILQQTFDEAGWKAIVEFMLARHVQGVPQRIGMNRWSTLNYHKDEIAQYLASVRGPDSPPLNYVIDPRPTGEAARVLITEYDIPAANKSDSLAWFNGSDWQAGAATSGAFPGAIHDVVVDASGNAWMNSINANAGRVAVKLDPETGQVSAYTVPGVTGGGRIYIDPDGTILWLGVRIESERPGVTSLGRIDTVSGMFEAVTAPPGMSRGLENQIAPTVDGKAWMATQFGAIRYDPTATTFRFKFFQDASFHDGFTYGIAADNRSNAWLAKYFADKIGHIDAQTGSSYEIDMRPPWLTDEEDILTEDDKQAYAEMGVGSWGGINMVPGGQAPRRLGYDPTADAVWVANNHGNNVVRIDAKTRATKYYRVPGPRAPYRVDVDNSGNAYVSSLIDDVLMRLNPATGEWTTFRMPATGCESRSIFVDRLRTEVWLPCDRTGRAVRVQFRTPAQLQTLRDAAR